MPYDIPLEIYAFIINNFPRNVGRKIEGFYKEHGYLPPSVSVREGLVNHDTAVYMPQKLFAALESRNAPDTQTA